MQSLLPLRVLLTGRLGGPVAPDLADLSVLTWVLSGVHYAVPWVGSMIISLLCIRKAQYITFGRKVTFYLGAHNAMELPH